MWSRPAAAAAVAVRMKKEVEEEVELVVEIVLWRIRRSLLRGRVVVAAAVAGTRWRRAGF
jgi:hypothetical protein